MQLMTALALRAGMTVSTVGGGGKTALIYSAAREVVKTGANALITTTTAISHPDHEHRRADHHLLIGNIGDASFARHAVSGRVVVAARAKMADGAKLKGFSPQRIDALQAGGRFDYIFVEADGAAGRPVKAPAGHEPVVPVCSALTVGVIGLDCLGKPLTDAYVHRPEHLAAVTGLSPGAPISDQAVTALVASPRGLFKSARRRKIVLLNKADDQGLQKTGSDLAGYIKRHCPAVERVLVAQLQNPEPVHAVFQ